MTGLFGLFFRMVSMSNAAYHAVPVFAKGQAAAPLASRWKARYLRRMEPDSHVTPKASLVEILFVVFLRLTAILCFWFGLQYWAMLVGYSFDGRARFDLLSLPWRVAASALAVAYPVVSLGLWLATSWGAVLWVMAAGAQLLMYRVWPEIYGHNVIVPLLHGLVAALYIVFRLALWLEEKRKMEERVRVDLP